VSGDAVKRQRIEERAAAWAQLRQAAAAEVPDLQRGYDTRYQQPDMTHEQAEGEALRAAALASRYFDEEPGLEPAAN
jgi:hypothetical protein